MRHAILALCFVLGLAACGTRHSEPAAAPPASAIAASPATAPAPAAPASCASADAPLDLAIIIGGGGPCGSRTCGKGTFCCNESCGICAPIGGGCTQQYCAAGSDDVLAAAGSCGGRTCGKGTWCCNASCARCVPIGMNCTQESCN